MTLQDELYWLALTVAQEAGLEPFEGKLGVASVICRRSLAAGASIPDTVLRRLQFSCWNTDSPTRMWIDSIPEGCWFECYKAACAAFFQLAPDPTHGATHYLNLALLPQPPAWYDPSAISATIGRHTFLRLS